MFKIDKVEPIPKSFRRTKYPFGELEVGDSFFVPLEVQIPKIVRNAADGYAKVHAIKLSVRTVPGGARCWRIA